MQLTLRTFTGRENALAVYRLADDSWAQVKLAQQEKLDADAKNGYGAFAPAVGAEFKFAAGGMRELDTADGYPHAGDCWEEDVGEGPMLAVQLHDEIGFEYERRFALEPVAGKSQFIAQRVSSRGRIMRLAKYDLNALPDLAIDDQAETAALVKDGAIVASSSIALAADVVLGEIDNHRSVTFDAASTVGVMATASTLTVAHTTANQPDRSMFANANWGTGSSQTLSSIQNDPTGTNQTLAAITSALVTITARKADIWAVAAPTVGTLNVVFTWSANTNGASSVWTVYGAHQTTLTSAVGTSSGTDTAPTLTLAGGATDEIALSSCVWNSASRTNTPDATWTNDWNSVGNNTAGNAGSHLTGGPSVVRTDSLNGSVNWGMTAVSVKAAAAGTTRGMPFGTRGTAFNGGRTFQGNIR